MFGANGKIVQRMAPMLKRVLVADPQAANARLVNQLMRDLVGAEVWAANSTEQAIQLAQACEPDIIFVELACKSMDGVVFTQRLRRSDLKCRQAPVVMMTDQATAAAILAARDAGVHEVLRKPFTVKDLVRRLEAVTLHPRGWVESVSYVGPDRRRFNSAEYAGPLKRRSDEAEHTDAARILQALKILRSAVESADADPSQALRAMKAQASDLQKAAAAISDQALASASAEFSRYLADVEAAGGALDKARLAQQAGPLLGHIPKAQAVAA